MSEKPSWLVALEKDEPTYSVSGSTATKTSSAPKTTTTKKKETTSTKTTSSSGSSGLTVEQQRANNSAIWQQEDARLKASNPNYDPGNQATWSQAQRDAHAANNALGGGGLETDYAKTGGTVQTGYNPAIPGKTTTPATQTTATGSVQTTGTTQQGSTPGTLQTTNYNPTFAENTAKQSNIKNYGADYLKQLADLEPPSYNYNAPNSNTGEYSGMLMDALKSQAGAGNTAFNAMQTAINTPADYYANMPSLPDFGSMQQSPQQLPWMNALAGQGSTQWVPTLASRQLSESTRQGDLDQMYKNYALQQQGNDAYLSRLLSASQLSQQGDQFDREMALKEYTGEAGVQNDYLTRLLSAAQLAQQAELAEAGYDLDYDKLQQGYDFANMDQEYKYDALDLEQAYKEALLRQQQYFGNIDAATALSQLFGMTVFPKNSGEDLFNQVAGLSTLPAYQFMTEWPLQQAQYNANIAKALSAGSGGSGGGGYSSGSSSGSGSQSAANQQAALDAQYASDWADYLARQEAYNNMSWWQKLTTDNPYNEWIAKYGE